MANTNDQSAIWSGGFGTAYTERNPHTVEQMDTLYRKNFGLARSELNHEFLGGMERALRILEVGTNVGVQLQFLQNMGFRELYGMDVQTGALKKAGKLRRGIKWIEGTASDIPFDNGFFDLVFTSGVLIHISPDNIAAAMREIHRCAKRYIWGFEYFSDKHTPIPYRGRDDLLWKANFRQLYLDLFPDLKLIKERKVPYLADDNCDVMFLLEKTATGGE